MYTNCKGIKMSNKVEDLFENTKNVGRLKNEANVSHVLYGSLESHLIVSFDFKIENEKVEKAVFKAYGNIKVIAIAQYICSFVQGRTISYINEKMDAHLIMNELDLKAADITIVFALLTAMNKALKGV